MNKMVVVLLTCHWCLIVFVSVAIGISEYIVSGETTRMLHNDVSVIIIERLENRVLLFKSVHTAVELTMIKGAPHVFLDLGW